MTAGEWITVITALVGLVTAIGGAAVGIIRALRANTSATLESADAARAHTAALQSQEPPR